jgi:acetate kinase
MQVLTIDAGSSSPTVPLIDAADCLLVCVDLQAEDGRCDVAAVWAAVREVDAVGHRVVHGGSVFTPSLPIDSHVDAKPCGLADLSPRHQPMNLTGIHRLDQQEE